MIPVTQTTGRAIHVAVNAHLLSLAESYRSAGINWYIYNLLNYLPEADRGVDYTILLGDRRYVGAPPLKLRFSRLPTHLPPVRIFWEQVLQPMLLRQAGVDLVHGTAFVGPLLSACPFVVTVHDLSFLYYPQGFRAVNRSYLRLFSRQSLRRAQRVIAVSASTKRDLIQCYGVPTDRIDVVYNGVDPAFQPLPADQVACFRARHRLPDRFVLFVGTLEPRKNVTGLIEAYARLPRGRPPLMLVGGKGWLYDQIFGRVEALGLGDEVHFVGYVPAEDLPWWYNAAELLVYPSLYEGFGLPPLEAMACGTPVVTSSAASLPEVVGQAGLLVDATNTEILAAAIQRALDDQAWRTEMKVAGPARARFFTWRETAVRTVDSYRRALTPPCRPAAQMAGGGEHCV